LQATNSIDGILSRRTKICNIGFIALAAAGLFRALAKTDADPDLWGHLRFALDVLKTGQIRAVDCYSYTTAGQTWINHEWLSETLFGLAWTMGGTIGLQILKIVVGFAILGLLFRFLTSLGIPPLRAVILLIISFLMLMPTAFAVRPHMFTSLGFAFTMIILYQAESGQYKQLWTLPLIFAAWVNLHGGFLAGAAMVALWAFFHFLGNYRQWSKFLPPLIISAGATLLNPYGIKLPWFLLHTATVKRPEITEWSSLHPISITGGIYTALLAISVLGLVYSRRPKLKNLVVLFAISAILPFIAIRHVNLFAVAAVVFVGDHAADAWDRLWRSPSRTFTVKNWLVAILPALAAIFIFLPSLRMIDKINVDKKFYPVTAVAILKNSQAEGNLATSFNWGEYILGHLGPRIKVMMDGRRETVYHPEIYNQYISFNYGLHEWDEILKKFPTEMALLETGSASCNLLALKPEWQLIYKDEVSSLFVKKDSRWLEPIRKAAEATKPLAGDIYFP